MVPKILSIFGDRQTDGGQSDSMKGYTTAEWCGESSPKENSPSESSPNENSPNENSPYDIVAQMRN